VFEDALLICKPHDLDPSLRKSLPRAAARHCAWPGTDAYLAQLANAHGLKLATMDEALARKFPTIAQLVS